jgi:hypothetical protein
VSENAFLFPPKDVVSVPPNIGAADAVVVARTELPNIEGAPDPTVDEGAPNNPVPGAEVAEAPNIPPVAGAAFVAVDTPNKLVPVVAMVDVVLVPNKFPVAGFCAPNPPNPVNAGAAPVDTVYINEVEIYIDVHHYNYIINCLDLTKYLQTEMIQWL